MTVVGSVNPSGDEAKLSDSTAKIYRQRRSKYLETGKGSLISTRSPECLHFPAKRDSLGPSMGNVMSRNDKEMNGESGKNGLC